MTANSGRNDMTRAALQASGEHRRPTRVQCPLGSERNDHSIAVSHDFFENPFRCPARFLRDGAFLLQHHAGGNVVGADAGLSAIVAQAGQGGLTMTGDDQRKAPASGLRKELRATAMQGSRFSCAKPSSRRRVTPMMRSIARSSASPTRFRFQPPARQRGDA